MDTSERLYNLIFDLPQRPSELTDKPALVSAIQEIITLIKILKSQSKFNEITARCFKNQRLHFVSKLIREQMFRVVNEKSERVEKADSTGGYPSMNVIPVVTQLSISESPASERLYERKA